MQRSQVVANAPWIGHVISTTLAPNSNVEKRGYRRELLLRGTADPDAIGWRRCRPDRFDSLCPPPGGDIVDGDELVEPGEPTDPDQIINSISKALDGLVRQWGGEPVYLGIARDSPEAVRAKLDRAKGLDLLVTIGGASVGDHDHLRQVFN